MLRGCLTAGLLTLPRRRPGSRLRKITACDPALSRRRLRIAEDPRSVPRDLRAGLLRIRLRHWHGRSPWSQGVYRPTRSIAVTLARRTRARSSCDHRRAQVASQAVRREAHTGRLWFSAYRLSMRGDLRLDLEMLMRAAAARSRRSDSRPGSGASAGVSSVRQPDCRCQSRRDDRRRSFGWRSRCGAWAGGDGVAMDR